MNKSPPPGAFDYLVDEPLRPPTRADRTVPLDVLIRRTQERIPREPPRVRVEIEINQRQPPPPQRSKLWHGVVLLIVVIALLSLMGGCAQAQPTQWNSYKQGFLTMHDGSDGTHAQSYTQGFITHTDITLPDGAKRYCQSYQADWRTITECNE
jgi:hypothetical protein